MPHKLNIALVGERHSGKTSLINEIQNLLIKSKSLKKGKQSSQSPSRSQDSSKSIKAHIKTGTKWKEDKGRDTSNDSSVSSSSSSKNKLVFKKTLEYGENGSLDFKKLNSSYFKKMAEEKAPKFPIDVPYQREGQQQVLFRLKIIEKEIKNGDIDTKMSYEDIDLVIFTGELAKKNTYKPYMKTAVKHFLRTQNEARLQNKMIPLLFCIRDSTPKIQDTNPLAVPTMHYLTEKFTNMYKTVKSY